jgi:DNA-directed RNA polymerase II subunit RPB1
MTRADTADEDDCADYAVSRLSFSPASPEDILRDAACEVTASECFRGMKIVENGPCDLRMGSYNKYDCKTCFKKMECTGHQGFITLAAPMLNPSFMSQVKLILDVICLRCFRFKLDGVRSLQRLKHLSKTRSICGTCHSEYPAVIANGPYFDIVMVPSESKKANSTRRPFPPDEIYAALMQVDVAAFRENFRLDYDPSWLMFTLMPVLDNLSRPNNFTGHNISIDKLSLKLKDIVTKNKKLAKLMATDTPRADIITQMCLLQDDINMFYTNKYIAKSLTLKKSTAFGNRGGAGAMDEGAPLHIRLAGKEGQLRTMMMGKRHDHCARSVITGDPTIDLDQIGIPEAFAQNNTYPEHVYSLNLKQMREYVRIGFVRRINRRNGKLVDLRETDPETRAALAEKLKIGDTVHRRILDNDIVSLNRQPSLHRGSIQTGRALILPGNTIRMSVLLTPPFNAD